MGKKGLMICSTANGSIKLNESASAVEKKYILEGVFAELDTMNRNSRIYTKEEYLKHLQYLRDDIAKGENPLGELDHPEDRFEVKLKDASHKIVDLWYDKDKNVIMGKIELLDTPNGKIAKSLVDQNIPLHISSRAAGSVNSDNTVSIQQIYTYDLVCKPGFANAVLHRVNESFGGTAYGDDITDFFNKTNKTESMNIASKLGLLEESLSITEVNSDIKLRAEAQKIQEDENEEKNDDADSENTDDTSSETEDDKGIEILDVRPIFSDVEIIDVKAEYGEGEEGDESETEDEDETEKTKDEAEETVECGDDANNDEKEKKATEKNKLFDCDKDDIKCREDEFNNKFDELVAAIKSKGNGAKKQNESLLTQYPVSACMNESDFVEFARLSESQKNRVVAYLQDNNITSVDGINENWRNGVNYEQSIPVWLKRAPEDYRELYENASPLVKASISTTAEYLIFESQNDIDEFWFNTGLRQRMEREMINESFKKSIPNICVESNTPSYDKSFIDNVVAMAMEFNSKY